MKSIPVLVLGCGGVGSQLLLHIVACRSLHCEQGLVLRVKGVCDSRSLLLVDDVSGMDLSDELLLELCRAKSSGDSFKALNGSGVFKVYAESDVATKIVDVASVFGKSIGLVVVDCSASSETIKLLKQISDLGCCVVLANKKPLTCDFDHYQKLISNRRHIRYESTVGAGLPVIASVTRVLASGDPVYRIIGSLSGTLGYLMSELEDGKLFSQVVSAAKGLGYTEPDPRDDLSGMDVARKALILARLLGRQINLDDIKVESLYPDELGPSAMSTQEFLTKGVTLLDKNVEERVRAASLKGNVLRYVCMIDGLRCQVGLQELPKDSPLGRLRGSDNVIEIYSRCYKNSPLVIQGAGAGNDTTAAGVLADIIDLQDLFK